MVDNENGDEETGNSVDPAGDAKNAIERQSSSRKRKSSYKAKAELEEDLEQAYADRNTERFLFFVTIVAIFDAFVFSKYENWSQAICLTAVEAGGLFVLARYLEVDEFISLMIEGVRDLGKPKSKGAEDDPP